jgi:hypothetical protein
VRLAGFRCSHGSRPLRRRGSRWSALSGRCLPRGRSTGDRAGRAASQLLRRAEQLEVCPRRIALAGILLAAEPERSQGGRWRGDRDRRFLRADSGRRTRSSPLARPGVARSRGSVRPPGRHPRPAQFIGRDDRRRPGRRGHVGGADARAPHAQPDRGTHVRRRDRGDVLALGLARHDRRRARRRRARAARARVRRGVRGGGRRLARGSAGARP